MRVEASDTKQDSGALTFNAESAGVMFWKTGESLKLRKDICVCTKWHTNYGTLEAAPLRSS